MPNPGWIVIDRQTGRSVMETTSERVVEALNGTYYRAVAVPEFLGTFNRLIKEAGGIDPAPEAILEALGG